MIVAEIFNNVVRCTPQGMSWPKDVSLINEAGKEGLSWMILLACFIQSQVISILQSCFSFPPFFDSGAVSCCLKINVVFTLAFWSVKRLIVCVCLLQCCLRKRGRVWAVYFTVSLSSWSGSTSVSRSILVGVVFLGLPLELLYPSGHLRIAEDVRKKRGGKKLAAGRSQNPQVSHSGERKGREKKWIVLPEMCSGVPDSSQNGALTLTWAL